MKLAQLSCFSLKHTLHSYLVETFEMKRNDKIDCKHPATSTTTKYLNYYVKYIFQRDVMDNYYMEQRGRFVFSYELPLLLLLLFYVFCCYQQQQQQTLRCLPIFPFSNRIDHIKSQYFIYVLSVMLSCGVENSLLGGHLFSQYSFSYCLCLALPCCAVRPYSYALQMDRHTRYVQPYCMGYVMWLIGCERDMLSRLNEFCQ